MIAFEPTFNGVIQEVQNEGGSWHQLTHIEKGETTHRWPDLLPDGKAVLFAAATSGINFGAARIAIQPDGTGERRNLVQGATFPRYASSGHLIYAQAGHLMAVPFDPQKLAVSGAAVPVVEGVMQSQSSGAAQYSLSGTGSLAYVPGGIQSAQTNLVWVDRKGAEQALAAPVRGYLFPRLSPDGRRIAVTVTDQDSQIWLYDMVRGTMTRFTLESGLNYAPLWTPDGKRIAFESNKAGPLNIFWQLADGSGGLERLTTSDSINAPMSFSPDGRLLAFIEVTPGSILGVMVLQMGESSGGSGRVRNALPFLRETFNEVTPRFSPDGRWLSYASDESGRYEVYVQPYPGPGGKLVISTDGGTEPIWNPNGRELIYRSGDKMMAVDVSTQSGFTAGKPRMLFEGRYERAPIPIANYDVSPDGQRFLMLKPSESTEAAPTQINVVLNWFEELKRKVPTGTK
jgi:serine/threonine-protein kinase